MSKDIKEKLRQKIQAKIKNDTQNNTKDPLFDNPTFVEMKNSLSPEEQKKYEEYGKHMYENLDDKFNEKGEMNAAIDTVSQIKLMLESGLHPSFLTKEEKEFLTNYLGEKWYLQFGYLENDLNRINM
jgi:hypothetical protein